MRRDRDQKGEEKTEGVMGNREAGGSTRWEGKGETAWVRSEELDEKSKEQHEPGWARSEELDGRSMEQHEPGWVRSKELDGKK